MSGYADLSRAAYISPNDLMASTRVNYAPQEFQLRNQLLEQDTQINQQALGSHEAEFMGRAATALLDPARYPDEASRAAAYPGAVAELQRYGFAKNAPSAYPGEAALRRVAALAVPAVEQYKRGQDAAAGVSVGGAYGFGPGAAGGGGGGAAPLTPFVARNLPPGITPEEDLLVRTASGEAADQGPIGQQAVAAVIRNRMRESGRSASDVIFAANQFEPWNNPATRAKLEAMDPNSPQYQAILANLRANQADPTGGATHFYSPKAQQALGRQPPSWSNTDPSAVIGGHNFYRIGYRPGGAAPAAPGQPQAPPGGSTPPPGVQMGGLAPPPPGGAPGAYSGGGFGTALNPTPSVATTPPASSGGTASNVPATVGAIEAGMAQARYTPMAGVQTAGPGAPTGTQVASVEPPPQPGWGTAVGTYGGGAAAAPVAPTTPATAQQPPAPTAPAPAQMPAELQTDAHNLTARDRAELKPMYDLMAQGRLPVVTFQNEVQQRQTANLARQDKWQAQERQKVEDTYKVAQEERAKAEELRKIADAKQKERGTTQQDRDNYDLSHEDPKSQKFADAYVSKKWQIAPNGNVIEQDMSQYPAPGRSIQRPTFLPAPTPQGLDEVRKADTDAKVITSALDHYVDVYQATGGKNWGAYFDNPTSPQAQQLLGAFDRLKTVLRSPVYYNTGVLQPAEMELLKQDLVSPKSLRGLFATPEALATRLGEIKLAILTRQDAELRSIGKDGVIVRDEADYSKVPVGGRYYGPDGHVKVKTVKQ